MRKANIYAVMTAAAVSMAILSGCSGSQTAATTAAETTTVAETTAEETTAAETAAAEEDEERSSPTHWSAASESWICRLSS